VFTFIGALHDLAYFGIFSRWTPILTFAYLAFACLSISSLKLAPFAKQERWPAFVNVLVNLGLVVGTFEISKRLYLHLVAGSV
jgi:hypothetical protein